MLMEHLLCDDVGGKRNVCGMGRIKIFNIESKRYKKAQVQ